VQCIHCQTPVPDDARFCHACGSQVSDAEGQAAATASLDQSALAHIERMLREETTGEFEIKRLIGRGGMAIVYLAREVHLDRQVAIKVLPPELTFGHGVERFKREAKTAAALDHPNIIPVYRVGSSGKIFWYAMKFLQGRSLDDLLKERKHFTLDETIDILSQVADALDYAHQHQVIHRDVKPANVMLDQRNRVVVTDFGIAKALTEGGLTASGSIIGTPYFMSPEQAMGQPVSGSSDQYSVGVMAYRMLAGQVPFEGDSAIDILHKHCTLTAPELEGIQPGLPQHTYRAIHKALSKDPQRRFPTVGDFVEAMRSATRHTPDTDEMAELATLVVPGLAGRTFGSTGNTAAPAPEVAAPPTGRARTVRPLPPRAAPPTRRTGLWVGIAAVVLAGAAVGTWMAVSGGEDAAGGQAEPTADSTPTVAAPAPAPPPAPTTATVTVRNLPAGAQILADGAAQGGDAFTLAAGPHAIRVTAPGFEPWEVTIPVAGGRDTSVTYAGSRVPAPAPVRPAPAVNPPARPPVQQAPRPAAPATGTLQIRIRPAATVVLDGVNQGQKALLEATLSAGQHVLRIERDGYITVDTTITIVAGQPWRSLFTLQQR
jgi:serine/threonine-protein kinase